MYFDVECPFCGHRHKIEDEDYYKSEDPDHRSNPYVCWRCYCELEDKRAIEVISKFLNTLDNDQLEMVAVILDKLSTTCNDQGLFKRIIKEYFKGYEGISTWGLW